MESRQKERLYMRHVMDAQEEQKHSRLKQNTVVIEGFKCDLSLSLFVQES